MRANGANGCADLSPRGFYPAKCLPSVIRRLSATLGPVPFAGNGGTLVAIIDQRCDPNSRGAGGAWWAAAETGPTFCEPVSVVFTHRRLAAGAGAVSSGGKK